MSRIHVLSIFTLSALACADDGRTHAGPGLADDDGIDVADEVGESGQATGGTASSSADTNDTADTGGDESAKFDVLEFPDGGGTNNCGAAEPDVTHSYIWIANTDPSTISKINTQTLVEEGRYLTRPDSSGSPSRTSVALSGNVAVANRKGGVTKFYAALDDCQDSNGVPGIQTSTGPTDVLAWGQDECMAWYSPFGHSTQRPVAWAQGEFDEATCAYEHEMLWTAGGMGTAEVVLLDGDDGKVAQTVMIPDVVGWAGLYGGAVDGDGNFWTVDHNWAGPSTLIRVDRATFAYATWPVEGKVHYGLAVDSKGRAWLCGNGGASRFDPSTETWAHLPPINPGSPQGGCMEDGEGVLWTGSHPDAQLIGIDTETVQIVQTIPVPEYVHGVSIDFEGHVWGVEFEGTHAYRVDPETLQVDTVSGLIGAYTYSDMTGFAISAAGSPVG